MKKLLGIVVLGFYGRTSARPAHREIKPQFNLVKILMLA